MSDLTHIGPDGRARMVDVSSKSETQRVAVARGKVCMSESAFQLAVSRQTKKGDPLAIGELAGIMGAKKTSDLIPLCHPLPLTGVKLDIEPDPDETHTLLVTASVKTTGKTGVEMEALTAVSTACLTIYDMLKAVDKAMVIKSIELIQKSGGKSGDYRKPAND
tara:strand:+ start:31418 stop:31906 length:489 start_codon:yes stop_codon:yes gene_type:complete